MDATCVVVDNLLRFDIVRNVATIVDATLPVTRPSEVTRASSDQGERDRSAHKRQLLLRDETTYHRQSHFSLNKFITLGATVATSSCLYIVAYIRYRTGQAGKQEVVPQKHGLRLPLARLRC